MATDLALAMAADYLFGDNFPSGAEVHITKLAELLDDFARLRNETPPCPTCPSHAPSYEGTQSFSTFGPCKDGQWHDTTCDVARTAMAKAKWPCGALKYPSTKGGAG
jgi:hypothetical protein